jgi:lipoic acid synthetase
MLTLGQYLQPSKYHLAVEEYITPEQFEKYRVIATQMGFSQVARTFGYRLGTVSRL